MMHVCEICRGEVHKSILPCGQIKYYRTCSVECGNALRKQNAKIAMDRNRRPAPIRICGGCGLDFTPPMASNGSYRRTTCSPECAKTAKIKSNVFTEKRRAHMSEVNRVNKRYLVMHTKEAREKAGPNISSGKFGKSNIKNMNKPYNLCVFTSPHGVDYETNNIAMFVREHPDLFSHKDAEWRDTKIGSATKSSRARNGLSSLSCGACMTWKGWTIRSKNGYEFGSVANSDECFGNPPMTTEASSPCN